jgi:hypothetical protein
MGKKCEMQIMSHENPIGEEGKIKREAIRRRLRKKEFSFEKN